MDGEWRWDVYYNINVRISVSKKKRSKQYKCIPFNIHIKGPELNMAYTELFNSIKESLINGDYKVPANDKGIVLRCLSGSDIPSLNATSIRLLKYNSNATGLAWDLTKEELISNTGLVSAQVVNGIFFHDLHTFVLLPQSHGPSDKEVEEYLVKVFLKAIPEGDESSYLVETNVYKQSAAFERINSWDIIKKIDIIVFRNNPINNDIGNSLSELADLLTSDRIEIKANSRAKSGISKDGISPIIEGADRLSQSGQARIVAEGVIDGDKDFIDTKESKTHKMFVKSLPDDSLGLFGKIKESLQRFLGNES